MSLNYCKLCEILLEDHFGAVVSKVGVALIRNGSLNLSSVMSICKLPLDKVRQSLIVLIQHGYVSFRSETGYTDVMYRIHSDRIQYLIRFPKYISHACFRLGPEASTILEELASAGQCTLSKVLYVFGYRRKQKATITASTLNDYLAATRDVFKKLLQHQYVAALPKIVEEADSNTVAPIFEEDHVTLSTLPQINLNSLTNKIMTEDSDLSEEPDADQLWRVNSNQFHLEMRNSMILSALEKKFKPPVDTRIFNIILDIGFEKNPWNKQSTPVGVIDIKSHLSRLNGGETTIKYLNEHLDIIEEDPLEIVTKTGFAQQGQYVLSVQKAVTEILWSTVERIIVERHGYFAVRVFRLIKNKGFIEQDRIHELAMIPAKEAKSLTYKLVEDNFIIMKEVRKSYAVSASVNKIAYVFNVDINQVAHTLLESCLKAMCNCFQRSQYQKSKHRRVMAKQERIERILASMTQQGCSQEQLEEIRELITPPEQCALEKVGSETDKLTSGVLHIDETVFTVQMFLFYNSIKTEK